ncbi:hypothetical protein PR048_009546 [Dryococelus australis]|uniref:Uncharacterized protein n=1 Tax=Dryococelus australis TaxID=614101 RepID=A0ABQ9I082_9NEOP|nr:hypothetical protein PR048_009546 [Dryococelus australis]
MPFAVPMVWLETTNHFDDCYFCSAKTEGYPENKKPIHHGVGLHIPISPVNWTDMDSSSFEEDRPHTNDSVADPTYIPQNASESYRIEQNELNDLVRDLGLSKQQSELLGSRLQECCIVFVLQYAGLFVFLHRYFRFNGQNRKITLHHGVVSVYRFSKFNLKAV